MRCFGIKLKYLGINLKYVQDVFTQNFYKTLMKEIKDDLIEWKDVVCLWIERLTIKMTILSNLNSVQAYSKD